MLENKPIPDAELALVKHAEGPTLDDVIAATEAVKKPAAKPTCEKRPILNRPLTGNGYPLRHSLKKIGCRWSGDTWYAPLAVADKAQRMIDEYREPNFSYLPAWEIPNGHDY